MEKLLDRHFHHLNHVHVSNQPNYSISKLYPCDSPCHTKATKLFLRFIPIVRLCKRHPFFSSPKVTSLHTSMQGFFSIHIFFRYAISLYRFGIENIVVAYATLYHNCLWTLFFYFHPSSFLLYRLSSCQA